MNRLTMILIVIAMPTGAAHAGQNLNFQVNDFADGSQSLSDLSVAPDTSVVIVWNSGCPSFFCPGDPGQDGDEHGVFAKRIDKDGNDLPPPTDQGNGIGNEFQVNTFTRDRGREARSALKRGSTVMGRFLIDAILHTRG